MRKGGFVMSTTSGDAGRFEVADLLMVRYSYHYGGITPFFQAIAERSATFRITMCEACDLRFCPPRYHCPSCWAATTWTTHDGAGIVESVVWAYWIPSDSRARAWTDLPYAYGAIRLAGCHNLMRTRVTGLDPAASLSQVTGSLGTLKVVAEATGLPGDVYFEVAG
jgi:uncharacterized OB-fold protein